MSQDSASVADLIARARRGEEQGRERLFEACRSYLAVMARNQVETWLRRKVDASDVVQQTMLEAHRDFERFDGQSEGEWIAWLKKILTRNAADFVRHYKGTAKRNAALEVHLKHAADGSSVIAAEEPPAGGVTPSQEFLQRDDELRVAEALLRLPDDYREVIELRNLQRLPFNEVAERMGRSRPAVQMLWLRAIRKMQEVLGAE